MPIFWHAAAGAVLPLMVGRVMFLPNSADARVCTSLSAAFSSGTRLSTTWPLVVWTALLSPLSTLMSWAWANWFAVTHSCWNFGLARILLMPCCRYPLTPLLSGPASLAALGGSALAMTCCGFRAA